MKKTITRSAILIVALAAMAALHLNGVSGCGGSTAAAGTAGGGTEDNSVGGTSTSTSGAVTTEQRQMASTQMLSGFVSSASRSAALVVDSDTGALKTKDITIPCDTGTADGDFTSGSTTITYHNCGFTFGGNTIVSDGTATISTVLATHVTTITYASNFTQTYDSCGTFGITGTIQINTASAVAPSYLPNTIVLNLTTTRAGSSDTLTGTITHNANDTLTGNLAGPLTCTFNNTATTCPAIITACGLSPATFCTGNEFNSAAICAAH